ncbi:MAG TPA: pantoate--beta-alanine ligase [Streptosporangiales bacterium]
MRVVRDVPELRDELSPARRAGRTIGLVPTMGFLHEGHLSLLRRGRRDCDVVVMSLFVNPAQFDEAADLAAYPRDEGRDLALAGSAGADVVFAPPVDVVYPGGFTTSVCVTGPLTETLEGAQRGPAHFHGVTTVVTKLFNMVQPDVAYFGQKDAQQAAVVRTLVRDLDLPVRIAVCPTVREPDGLALSSRNVHLHGDDRKRALALRRGLDAAEATARDGVRDASAVRAAVATAMGELDVEPEYVAVVDPETLAPLTAPASPARSALVAVAARVGGVRLIDNTTVSLGNGESR